MASTVLMDGLKRLIRRLLLMVLVVYGLLCTLVYLGQDWLAFPGTTEQGKPQTNIYHGSTAQTLH